MLEDIWLGKGQKVLVKTIMLAEFTVIMVVLDKSLKTKHFYYANNNQTYLDQLNSLIMTYGAAEYA